MTARLLIVTIRSFLASHAALVRLVTVLSVVFGSSLVGLALATGLLTTGVATSAQAAPGCAQRMHAQLFFGLLGPQGPISEADWEKFLLDEVTPRFPNGLTVLHASGHWKPAGGPLQREASRVLEIVYDESPKARRLMDQIAAIYKARFQQESVMVVRAPAFVCF